MKSTKGHRIVHRGEKPILRLFPLRLSLRKFPVHLSDFHDIVTHINTHTNTDTRIHQLTDIHTQTYYTYTRTHTQHTNTKTHKHTQVYTHVHMYVCTRTPLPIPDTVRRTIHEMTIYENKCLNILWYDRFVL